MVCCREASSRSLTSESLLVRSCQFGLDFRDESHAEDLLMTFKFMKVFELLERAEAIITLTLGFTCFIFAAEGGESDFEERANDTLKCFKRRRVDGQMKEPQDLPDLALYMALNYVTLGK
ncbi:unnamed protein product [Leuciscus chuanchicus]